MRRLLISVLAIPLFAAPALAQDSVRGALLGNDPRATVTTGIGQVVTPVGIPVIRSPGAPPPPTVAPVTPKGAPSTKLTTDPRNRKVDGKYEIGEVTQKPKPGTAAAAAAAAAKAGTTPANTPQLLGGGMGGTTANAVEGGTEGGILVRPGRFSPVMRIPTSKYPTVQRILSR